jgi:ubiquitin carboxyl-terminal hydrolase L3
MATLTLQWAKPIGLPDGPLSFQELFSLDEDFLAFVPKPVKAVLLLFPTAGALQQAREAEENDPELKFKGSDVWWIKQTVSRE